MLISTTVTLRELLQLFSWIETSEKLLRVRKMRKELFVYELKILKFLIMRLRQYYIMSRNIVTGTSKLILFTLQAHISKYECVNDICNSPDGKTKMISFFFLL